MVKKKIVVFSRIRKMSKIGQILIKFSKVLFFGWNDACSQKKSPKAMFAIISVKIWV